MEKIHKIMQMLLRGMVFNDGAGYEQADGTYALFPFRYEQLAMIAQDPIEEFAANKDYLWLLEECEKIYNSLEH
jgi:hypothetical protein